LSKRHRQFSLFELLAKVCLAVLRLANRSKMNRLGHKKFKGAQGNECRLGRLTKFTVLIYDKTFGSKELSDL
jgi:hypothetical protein